jgi:tRNA(Arg) A34 adenosine deaminase TadA
MREPQRPLSGRASSGPIEIHLPAWVDDVVDWDRRYAGDEERVRLAIALSRENVERAAGGPFGAVVFESDTGAVVGAGVNCVERLGNAVLHAEVVALMFAQRRVGSFTLGGAGAPAHELVSSCEPCAMCLGAVHWSGVRRLVFAAAREDASALAFDEGPVFPESYAYLEQRGLRIDRGVLRDEAAAVLAGYRARGGRIYNR